MDVDTTHFTSKEINYKKWIYIFFVIYIFVCTYVCICMFSSSNWLLYSRNVLHQHPWILTRNIPVSSNTQTSRYRYFPEFSWKRPISFVIINQTIASFDHSAEFLSWLFWLSCNFQRLFRDVPNPLSLHSLSVLSRRFQFAGHAEASGSAWSCFRALGPLPDAGVPISHGAL